MHKSTFQLLFSLMIVCICRRVSDKTIAQCAHAGMGFEDIQIEHGVATQCGKCEASARGVWSECSASLPVAHVRFEDKAPVFAI